MKTQQKSLVLILLLTFVSNFLFAQKLAKTKNKILTETPRMDVLNLFTAAKVPAMAPEEELAPLISSTEETPANFTWKRLGSASHVIYWRKL